MSLRTKTTLFLLANIILLVLALLVTSSFILYPSYVSLAQMYLHQDSDRVVAQLQREEERLAQYAQDWSSWDDTYRFVQEPNEAYVASNLVESTFANNDLLLLLVVNEAREVVYGGVYDADHGRVTSSHPIITDLLYEPGTNLLRPERMQVPQTGIYRLPDSWLMLTGQPILDSGEQKPARGVLLMGRLLDEPFLQRWSQDIGVNTVWLPLPEATANFPDVVTELLAAPPATNSETTDFPFTTRTHNDHLHGYLLLSDWSGQPTAVLQIINDQTIIATGQRTLDIYIFVNLIISLFAILLMWYFLTTQIINRVEQIQQGVLHLRQTSDFSYRLPVQGKDELTNLSQELNHLVQVLDQTLDLQSLTENALRTEQQKLEERVRERTEALAEANARLRQLDASKTQFINDISHEFRTPVTSLNLYFDLWQRGNPTQQERYLRVIGEQIQRIVNLTDSVMRLAHIEFPSHEPPPAPILLTELWAGLGAKYGEMALAKGLQLQISCDPKLKLEGYPDLLATMFEELLENSLNYSEQGCVVLTARPCSPPAACIHIELTDQGIGIPPEELPLVSERFYRGTGASQSNRPGIGVGLTMVKHIVALHGGEWEIKSAVGEGTAVTITLPLTPPPPASNQLTN
jgi:signal transduction histidine kinase